MNRPQRRNSCNINNATGSETWLAGEGKLCEIVSGNIVFRGGCGRNECQEAGFAFGVKAVLVSKLAGLPKVVNDKFIAMKFPVLSGKKTLTIISAYAPTMTNLDELNICIQPKRHPQGKKAHRQLNTIKLMNLRINQYLLDALEEHLESTLLDRQNVEANWATLRELISAQPQKSCGPQP
ncbi:Hypothetical predicted protein [Pelobates cultripes]|uniref:Uncharacterized protein n=1 Tax=Pelobates cultripes TaxID=61616 RepID=A0AAD1VVJ0_PELCU|nr:Hypothetical predicted protein [Pelobates cultripes]